MQKYSAKCKNAVQSIVRIDFNSAKHQSSQHLTTFVCKTWMGMWLFAGTSGAEGCSNGFLFYRVSQQLGTSFLLIICADHIIIKKEFV